MNALTQIVADPVDAAVAKANEWLNVARPIIIAHFALEDAEYTLRHAGFDMREAAGLDRYGSHGRCHQADAVAEAAKIVTKASKDLYDFLDGVRNDRICDQWKHEPNGPSDDSEAAQAVYDAECDACRDSNDRLERETISVDRAVRIVGDEQ